MTLKRLPSPVVKPNEQVLDASQIHAAGGDPLGAYDVGPVDVIIAVVLIQPRGAEPPTAV